MSIQHNHRSWLFDSLTALRAGGVLANVFIDTGEVPGTSGHLMEDRDNILARHGKMAHCNGSSVTPYARCIAISPGHPESRSKSECNQQLFVHIQKISSQSL